MSEQIEHGAGCSARPRASPSFWLGLLAVLLAAICACDLARAPAVAGLAAASLVALVAARVRPPLVLVRLVPLLSFGVVALALILVLPAPEEAATITLLSRRVPEQGVRFLSAVVIKSALLVLMATAFAERLSERDVLTGLTGWRLPAKVVSLCYLTLRSLHTVRDELLRLLRARDARGAPRGLRAVTTAGDVAQMLLVRLGRRAETQALALCARGYRGRLVVCDDGAPSWPEAVALTCVALGLLWLILL